MSFRSDADPPMLVRVTLIPSAALRPFALLLMRELGTAKAAEYWDHLIVSPSHCRRL